MRFKLNLDCFFQPWSESLDNEYLSDHILLFVYKSAENETISSLNLLRTTFCAKAAQSNNVFSNLVLQLRVTHTDSRLTFFIYCILYIYLYSKISIHDHIQCRYLEKWVFLLSVSWIMLITPTDGSSHSYYIDASKQRGHLYLKIIKVVIQLTINKPHVASL